MNDIQGWDVRPAAMQAALDGLRESTAALRRAAYGQTVDAAASRITELTDILQRYVNDVVAIDESIAASRSAKTLKHG
ncbi:hypothetical protein [Mycobacteroides abscessus]|uniref:hypothetical protein n=1 Tax=Mycobacteroides abscessus TaxID=36809 RepID=UPI0019264C2E|nr:hypothetical protein [Mycobacteroides abscessus]MBL3752850.1 hypothetical protein [Mycobacteroides abscessus subsp. massiliense]